jgi:uncharacterized protein YdbL (DUF1318 family)
MSRRFSLILAAALGAAALGGSANAYLQADASASLRASGKVGEQADGYLGLVDGDVSLRAQVEAINIKRRAYYTDLAAKRGAKIEEVAAATACEILASRVQPGQFYRLSDGAWRKRDDGAPVQRPGYCG